MAPAPNHVSKLEGIHYYNGVSLNPPKLYYCSNIATVKFKHPGPGQQRFFKIPFKTAEGVLGTPIVEVWDAVAPLIVALFKKTGVKYSAFLPAFFLTINEDGMTKDMGPLVIWVATHPGTTFPEKAEEVSPAVLSVLVDHGIEGAVVEWIEGSVEPLLGPGPSLMPTVENTNPTHDVRHTFTALHGMSFTPADREGEPDAAGTVSIYFHQGGGSNRVLAASCKHVFHANTSSDYKYGDTAGERKQQVQLNSKRRLERALAAIKYKIDANATEDVDRLELKELRSEDEQDALDIKKMQLASATRVETQLRDFYEIVKRDWTDVAWRDIGYLEWAPPIASNVDDTAYTRDMAAFALYEERFADTFVGNVVDLGTKWTLHKLNTIFGGRFPTNMKLCLRGTVKRDDLSNPVAVDKFGNTRTVVSKDGSTTGLTFGNSVGIHAYLCDKFGRESRELAIYNNNDLNMKTESRTDFSAKGDSGAPIWNFRGEILGFIHSGITSKGRSSHVTFATPAWWYLKQLKKQYPDANFWGEKWALGV